MIFVWILGTLNSLPKESCTTNKTIIASDLVIVVRRRYAYTPRPWRATCHCHWRQSVASQNVKSKLQWPFPFGWHIYNCNCISYWTSRKVHGCLSKIWFRDPHHTQYHHEHQRISILFLVNVFDKNNCYFKHKYIAVYCML